MKKRWYRSRKDKMIGGVCGGIGEYFDIDPTIIRILFVIGLIMAAGFLAYIILWVVVPEEPLMPEPANNPSSTEETKTGAENTQTENKTTEAHQGRNRSGIFGGVLVIIGVLLLLDNFVTFHAFWPMVLIVIGVGILLKTRND